MNERYQKNTSPGGKTRKSAAAAKPKRSAADAPVKKSSAGKSASKSGSKSGRMPLAINPPTEEFRFWRRLWWILLLGSLTMTLLSLAVRQWLHTEVGANAVLVVAYVGMFAAFFLDWWKLRKLRREWQESGGQIAAEKPAKAEKASKADTEGKQAAEKDDTSSAADES